jgi:AcrR family transcriptional regulator
MAKALRARAVVGGVRPGGRSERVVREVLDAALAELADSGYAGLRFEEVAERAGVSKTTIYRRWPTKADLVGAAMRSMGDAFLPPPSDGPLEEQLFFMLKQMGELASARDGQCVARILATEIEDPEFVAIAASVRAHFKSPWMAVLRRAIVRGELPRGTDVRLVVDTLVATLSMRMFQFREPIDDHFLSSLVSLVLVGAKHGGGAA